jgi:hypothetical protein
MNVTKTDYKFSDFPVGKNVKIVSEIVDMHFFYGQAGYVEKNTGDYLGIKVVFKSKDGEKEYEFNFNPDNLEPLPGFHKEDIAEPKYCQFCGQKLPLEGK